MPRGTMQHRFRTRCRGLDLHEVSSMETPRSEERIRFLSIYIKHNAVHGHGSQEALGKGRGAEEHT